MTAIRQQYGSSTTAARQQHGWYWDLVVVMQEVAVVQGEEGATMVEDVVLISW
jgi:hypothetical protein